MKYPSTTYGHPTSTRQSNAIYGQRSISPRRAPKLRNPHHLYRRSQRHRKQLRAVLRVINYYTTRLYQTSYPFNTTPLYTYENQESAIKDFWVRNLPTNNSENTPINPTQTPQDRA